MGYTYQDQEGSFKRVNEQIDNSLKIIEKFGFGLYFYLDYLKYFSLILCILGCITNFIIYQNYIQNVHIYVKYIFYL